ESVSCRYATGSLGSRAAIDQGVIALPGSAGWRGRHIPDRPRRPKARPIYLRGVPKPPNAPAGPLRGQAAGGWFDRGSPKAVSLRPSVRIAGGASDVAATTVAVQVSTRHGLVRTSCHRVGAMRTTLPNGLTAPQEMFCQLLCRAMTQREAYKKAYR